MIAVLGFLISIVLILIQLIIFGILIYWFSDYAILGYWVIEAIGEVEKFIFLEYFIIDSGKMYDELMADLYNVPIERDTVF